MGPPARQTNRDVGNSLCWGVINVSADGLHAPNTM